MTRGLSMRLSPTRASSSPATVVVGCVMSVALSSTGCLDEPPTFEPRGQIPPFILAGRVEPPLGSVYEDGVPIDINVPFRSEDVGFPLEARLYLDLLPGAARGDADEAVVVPAGIFEDLTRSVQMAWVRSVPGCHSLTLILTYQGSYDVVGLPLDDTRAARVVWWLNMEDAQGTVRMSDCPGASQSDSSMPGVP